MNETIPTFDRIILDDVELRGNVTALFELENNCTTLCTVDMECVLAIVLSTVSDLQDKNSEDIQHLVENVILETTDLKHFEKLQMEESDAIEELQMVAKGTVSVIRDVLQSIENIGLPHGHFPYRLRHLLPNNALLFAPGMD